MKSIALKTMQKMAKIWPLDMSSVLSGEFEEEIDSALLQIPQVQEILHTIRTTDLEPKEIESPARGTKGSPISVPAVTAQPNSPPIRAMKPSDMNKVEEGSVTEEIVVPAMKSSIYSSPPQISQRHLPIPSPPLCREQSQKKQQPSPSTELESVDESLFELLLSSLPSEDHDITSSSSSRIELLGGCQEDFDAIDEELLKCAMQKQQQQQQCRRNYAKMMDESPQQSEKELQDLFRKEFNEFFAQTDFETRRQDLLPASSGNQEDIPLSPSHGDDSVKLLKIDSFDSEIFPFL